MASRRALTRLGDISPMTSVFERVLSFIQTPKPALFESLALEVFRYQFDRVEPYRNYCLTRGVDVAQVRSLAQVPTVATAAFKYAELLSAPPERIFLTSGTTTAGSRRGRHFVPVLEVYRASALAHLQPMLFPDRRRMPLLALHPTAERMPESSLGQMISWALEAFGTEPSLCAATAQGIELASARDFLLAAERTGHPVCIMGTTAACARLFEALRSSGTPLRLSPYSRLMDTGGAKGQTEPLTAAEVAALAARWLGLDPALVINEYGMTEMCSQFYDATRFNSSADAPPGERLKLGPPWVRASALDPVTLAPLEEGRIGLLSYFDLANVGSVSALLTEDLGTLERGAVRLLGRAQASEARGCALSLTDFAAAHARLQAGAAAR